MRKKRVLFIFGTRPEVIKLAPVIAVFKKERAFETLAVSTGQHREMLAQALKSFKLAMDHDLKIMVENQSLFDVTVNALRSLERLYKDLSPDMVFVQGDTTTAYCAALAAFYLNVPLAHVEAGLRTGDLANPFPEEANRVFIDRLSSLHFAATPLGRENLSGEKKAGIFVTGNTVVDALAAMRPRVLDRNFHFSERALPGFLSRRRSSRLILLTAHRRENFGAPLEAIFRAVRAILGRFKDVAAIYPVHLNPNVQKPARRILGGVDRVLLTGPLDYSDLVAVMARAHLVLTDSGGIQEEAPSFHAPVLVLRKVTERPEAVEAGCAEVAGRLEQGHLVRRIGVLLAPGSSLYRRMAGAPNPFGDGRASRRILEAAKWHWKLRANPPKDWTPSP